MMQVKLMVLPTSKYISGEPSIVAMGTITIEDHVMVNVYYFNFVNGDIPNFYFVYS